MNFNSIKVRLEHASDFVIPELDSIFQFHKGTIRTEQGLWTNEKSRNFNSIKVRLELSMPLVEKLFLLFQFHKGTIRTSYLNRITRV